MVSVFLRRLLVALGVSAGAVSDGGDGVVLPDASLVADVACSAVVRCFLRFVGLVLGLPGVWSTAVAVTAGV